MTHHDLDLSIRFPYSSFPLSPVSSPSFVLILSTLDPEREALARLVRLTVWINSALAPGEASPRLSLIYSRILPHSRLVCQRAIVLPLWTRAHSRLVCHRAQPPPFMPHSYALYPMTHPLRSLYAIGPCPLVTCDVTWSVPSIYREGP